MPAKALNSAADKVVGTAIMRTASAAGRIVSAGGACPLLRPARAIKVEILDRGRVLPQRDQHHLGGVDRRAAADRDDQVGAASRASRAPSMTQGRGECAVMPE